MKKSLAFVLSVMAFAWQTAYAAVPMLDAYSKVQMGLATDEYEAAQSAAADLVRLGNDWLAAADRSDPLRPHVVLMVSGATAVHAATEPQDLRTEFKNLSKGAVEFIKATPALWADWQLVRCPMTPGYQLWAQRHSERLVMNPYYGTEMQQCGRKLPWA